MVKLESKLIPKIAIVEDVRDETPNVRTFYLKINDLEKETLPGQFNELYIPGGGEVPISISDVVQVNGGKLVAHTIRFIGSVTWMFSKLEKGSRLGVRGPYGKGWPIERLRGKDVLLVAGGLGLAPLRPVIREVERNRGLYGRLIILYGARTPRDLLYRYEYHRYENIPDTELLVTVDKATSSWKGYVGVVTKLIPLVDLDVENTIALVCGPEIMMRFAVKELKKRGFKDNQIYLSLERRMKCGVGLCGHCQMGPYFVCKHGPVFPYWFIKKYFWVDQI